MKLKQILAGALAAVMVLTSVPVTANAATIPASLVDTAENPATIEERDASTSPLTIEKDGDVNGFSGALKLNASADDDKLAVTGKTKFLIQFKMKQDTKPSGTQSIIGKMDEGFGIQVNGTTNKLLMYGRDAVDKNGSQSWPTLEIQLEDSFYGTWHDISALYDGDTFKMKVDNGEWQTSESISEVTIRTEDNPFTIGYNPDKASESYQQFTGKLADVKMYVDSEGTVTGDDAAAVAAGLEALEPTLNLVATPESEEVPELTSVRREAPELGDAELTEDELALLNNTENFVMDVVFKYNTVPAMVNNSGVPLVTLTGENGKYFTVWHGGKRNAAGDGLVSCDLTDNGSGFHFGHTNSGVQDTEWHKLTVVLNGTHMYAVMDGNQVVYSGNTAGYQYSNQNSFKDAIGNFVNHTEWAITGLKVGATLEGATYQHTMNDFDGAVKYVEIRDMACADAAAAKAVNDATAETLTAEYNALKEECAALQESAYTADSWNEFQTVLTANSNASTEWAIYNAMDAISVAKEELAEAEVPSLPAAGVPSVKVAAPEVGGTKADAEVENIEAVEESLTDAVETDAAELTRSEGLTIEQDGEYAAVTGQVSVNANGAADKFMVSGSTKYLIKFMLKASEPSNSSTNYTVLQKAAGNYGLQINKGENVLKLYCNSSTNGWPQTNYTLPTGFWDTWHEIIAMYDGSGFRLYVDGTAGTAVSGRPTTFTLKDSYTGNFSVGYAADDEFSASIADVVMYKGEEVPETTSESTADTIKAALAEKTPTFKLEATPAVEGTGSECTVTSTTWTDETGTVMGDTDTFAQYTDYTMTVVLAANEGFAFADADKPATIKVGEQDVPVTAEISADRATMTITYVYDGGEDPVDAAKEALENAKASAQGIVDAGNDDETYTEESWNALVAALNAANAVDTDTADAETMQNAATVLNAALEGLQRVGAEITMEPDVTVAKPVAGEAVPSGLAALTEANLQTTATLVPDGTLEYGENGSIRGKLTDADPENSVFNVSGTTPLLFHFKMKANALDIDSTQSIVGKMNDQYGMQLKKAGTTTRLLFYAQFTDGNWPEVSYTIPNDEWWNEWHDIVAYYDGTRLYMYVDGNGPTSDRGNTGAIKNSSSAIFTIGYNTNATEDGNSNADAKNNKQMYEGWLNNIGLYIGENVPTDVTIPDGSTPEQIMQIFEEALADKESSFVLEGSEVSQGDYYEVTGTTWNPSEGTVDAYTDYSVEVELTAKDSWLFNSEATAVLRTEATSTLEGVETEVTDGGKKMTISYTFKGETHPKDILREYLTSDELNEIGTTNTGADGARKYTVATWNAYAEARNAAITLVNSTEAHEPDEYTAAKTTLEEKVAALALAAETCECELGDITDFGPTGTIDMGDAEEKTITLGTGRYSYSQDGACLVHSGTPTASYSLGSNTAGAELVEGNKLKVTKAGSVQVTLTVTHGIRTKSATITYTVTSNKSKNELSSEIDTAKETYKENNGVYTEDSWAKLQDAIAEAESVLGNANATEAQIAAAKQNLANAVSGLKLQADADKETLKSALKDLIDTVNAKTDKDYSVESWNKLVDALKAAVSVYNNGDATFDELKAAYDTLKGCSDGLETKAEAELKAAKADAAKALAAAKPVIDAGQKDYSDATWKAFKDAYDTLAKAPATATAAQLKEMIAKLTAAQKALAAAAGVKVGDTVVYKNVLYKVTNAEKKTVTAVKGTKKTVKKIVIPASVKVNGVSCTVTQIGANAFKNFKKMTKVTVGKNVTTIGKKAFFGCKKLKTVVVKGKSLKTIKAQAFKKTAAKVTVKAPKSLKKKQKTALLKKMKKKGMSKKSVVK